MTWLLHSLSQAVTWLAQIGDAAGAGYLVQMLLQKIKATLGVIDASVSGMCFGSHPSIASSIAHIIASSACCLHDGKYMHGDLPTTTSALVLTCCWCVLPQKGAGRAVSPDCPTPARGCACRLQHDSSAGNPFFWPWALHETIFRNLCRTRPWYTMPSGC